MVAARNPRTVEHPKKPWRGEVRALRPMLATLAGEVKPRDLLNPRWIYEPKYDGIRALVELRPPARLAGARGETGASVEPPLVSAWSRQGNEKTAQFPELVAELERLARRLDVPLVLDGEIIAVDAAGRAGGFQQLQARLHLTRATEIARAAERQPAVFVAFDILREGDEDLRDRPLDERRARLVRLLGRRRNRALCLAESVTGDGRALYERADREGWEGLVAKDRFARYETGRRSATWRKLKLVKGQEFVVGGWTEPRQTRQVLGALLLGVYEDGRLEYVGSAGSGFTERELVRLGSTLGGLEIDRCPFARAPVTMERPHWVEPSLVAKVKFTEWTAEGRLRHPTYVGLRDDRDASSVRRETTSPQSISGPVVNQARATARATAGRGRAGTRQPRRRSKPPRLRLPTPEIAAVIAELQDLEDRGRDGQVSLPDGRRLKVTNLRKVFWPDGRITKGDLLRHYAYVSPVILPVVADRPLVMKRFPNGITGQAFYQQRSRQRPPDGVRVEVLPEGIDPVLEAGAGRLVGGSLITLLYMAQIAAISQDPWFSRVQSPFDADYVALDLDPMDGVTFSQVLDVARWIRDELDKLGTPAFPKTSGASGLHVYIPLPAGTTYESGMLFCQIIATIVASKHPAQATVTRAVAARPDQTVYIDYLQNILGKPLATAYSARASTFAGVSAPVTWEEVDRGLDPRAFTIQSMPARLAAVGDLWEGLRTSPTADLRAVLRSGGPFGASPRKATRKKVRR